MSILDSLGRNIRNVFVGSHKGDDIKDDWFENPLDTMPVATDHTTPEPEWGKNKYHPDPNYDPNPRPEEDMADWFKVEKPDESDEIEEEKTMHQKMYEIATAKYNPFSIGGSENLNRKDK